MAIDQADPSSLRTLGDAARPAENAKQDVVGNPGWRGCLSYILDAETPVIEAPGVAGFQHSFWREEGHQNQDREVGDAGKSEPPQDSESSRALPANGGDRRGDQRRQRPEEYGDEQEVEDCHIDATVSHSPF